MFLCFSFGGVTRQAQKTPDEGEPKLDKLSSLACCNNFCKFLLRRLRTLVVVSSEWLSWACQLTLWSILTPCMVLESIDPIQSVVGCCWGCKWMAGVIICLLFWWPYTCWCWGVSTTVETKRIDSSNHIFSSLIQSTSLNRTQHQQIAYKLMIMHVTDVN